MLVIQTNGLRTAHEYAKAENLQQGSKKLPLRIVVSLCVILLLAGCSSKDDRRNTLLTSAKAYEASEKLSEAKLEARNALKLDPNLVEAYLLLGRCGLKENDWRSAYQSFSRALELDPENVEAGLNMSELFLRSGDPAQAERYLAHVLEKDPELIAARLLQAGIYIQNKNYTAAWEIYEKILAQNADHQEAILGMASLLTLQNEPVKARELLKGALGRKPESPGLLTTLLNLSLQDQNFAEATDYINRLLALDPKSQNLVLRMADIYFKTGRASQGLALLEDHLLSEPAAERVRLRLAEIYIADKRHNRAIDILNKAPQKTPDIQLMHALTLLSSNAENEGLAELEKIARSPSMSKASFRAQLILADVYIKQNQSDKALHELTELLRRNPGDLEALTKRAHLLIAKKQYAEAISDLRVVAHESPEDTNSAIALANAYNASGNSRLAEEQLKDIIKKTPGNALAYLTLANLYMQQERVDEAISTLRFGRSAINGISDLHLVEAEILSARQRYDEAVIVLNDLAKNDKFRLAAMLNIAAVYAKAGDYTASILVYDQILEQAPEYLVAVEGKLRAMIASGDTGRAVRYAETRQKERAADPRAAALTGEAAFADKDPAKAKQAFWRAMELAPQWDQPVLRLAQIYAGENAYAEGIDSARAFLAKNPDALAPSLLIALLQERNEDIAGAEQTYRQLLADKGYIPVVANNLANLLSLHSPDKERLAEAEQLALQSVKTEEAEAHSTLGWIYHLQGRYDAAESELRKALVKSPANKDIAYRLAASLVALNRKEEAKKLLTAMLSDESDFSTRILAQKLLDTL